MKQFEKSFYLLDKERVFKCNDVGEPNSFDFGVESIGFLEPSQIVFSSLKVLELRLSDLLECFSNKNDHYEYSENKINIEADLASKSAIEKLEKIGGSIQLKK